MRTMTKRITTIPYEPLRGYDFGKLPLGVMRNIDIPIYSLWADIHISLTRNNIQQ